MHGDVANLAASTAAAAIEALGRKQPVLPRALVCFVVELVTFDAVVRVPEVFNSRLSDGGHI